MTRALEKMAFGLVIGIAATSTTAQSNIHAKPNSNAYLQDSRGVIARGQDGLCWRTAYWTPADAVPGCDGELVPPIVNPTAPTIVPPPQVAQSPAAHAHAAPTAPKRCDFSVTLDGDQVFAFNKDVLSSTARKRIDEEVLSKIALCSKIDVVLITGHTDRLGSQQYNRRLSKQRADSVAAYLKSKNSSASIETVGAGETQPITACEDKAPYTNPISCLAPNRRVAIEVRGLAK
jgi:OOP family OmpA-OmpF porin